jgi:hypothetical protein
VYLSAAREHPPAVVQRQQQQDLVALLPTLRGLTDSQAQCLFLFASVMVRFKPTDFHRVLDADIADAAGAVAATLETAQRGVIYEHRATSLVAQGMTAEMKLVLAEAGKNGGSRFERDAAVALRAMEKGATSKPHDSSEVAYLELLRRLVGPAATAGAEASELPRPGTGLIIPGSA